MINTLKTLCLLSGVSGNEDEVRDYIIEQSNKYTDEVSTDVMGNVTVFKKGARRSAKKLLICAHMDEVGVIVTGITDDGYLKFAMVGAVDKRVVIGKTVLLGKERVIGLIGCKAIHLFGLKEREKVLDTDDMYIDIGAASKQEAQELVSLGDAGTFDDEITEFGDGFIKAKAIDDRLGCAVLLELIKSDLPVDCTFVFTVQEEVGLRGAITAAFRTAPDIALIIEGTTAADLPSVAESKKVCKIRGGVVIPFMDGATIYDKQLRNTVVAIADNNGIQHQTKNIVAGGTDAAAYQRSRAGVRTVGIAAPVRNLHSQSCVLKISVMEDMFRLAGLFLKEMAEV